MSRPRAILVALNVLGGVAVLTSYAHGVATHAEPGRIWGGIPDAWRPLYTCSMLAATLGYFPFTYHFLVHLDPARIRIGTAGWGVVFACYAAVLIGSALWMPLTFRMLEAPGGALWWLVRTDLLLVGAGAIGLLTALLTMRPRDRSWSFRAAVMGMIPFCWQTAVLDALVWPAYFPA